MGICYLYRVSYDFALASYTMECKKKEEKRVSGNACPEDEYDP